MPSNLIIRKTQDTFRIRRTQQIICYSRQGFRKKTISNLQNPVNGPVPTPPNGQRQSELCIHVTALDSWDFEQVWLRQTIQSSTPYTGRVTEAWSFSKWPVSRTDHKLQLSAKLVVSHSETCAETVNVYLPVQTLQNETHYPQGDTSFKSHWATLRFVRTCTFRRVSMLT